ncbi:hypothetical protein WJU16_24865 [Chitinophaga pollutisoli]|uniref:ZU5 domain-containing protein n=1 Tax=Chitinophaga pollutisoli TaxID=3133966 RepID=A0ABZ2YNZ6_9BACT
MRTAFFSFLICCATILAGCSKSNAPGDRGGPNDPPPQEEPDGSGEVTEAGKPDGTPGTEKAIGAAGGEITSADGKIKITVPPGVLANTVTIGIQRISNTNPLGNQHAYRLTPHGQRFNKPVQITFPYDDTNLKGTHEEVIGIAYQNEKGVWIALPVERNTTARTITVNTTHFSDWALFNALDMVITRDTLPLFTSTNVSAFCDDDMLAPLTPAGQPIKKRILAADKYVKSWRLTGAGKFEHEGAEGTYTAPGSVLKPPQNPATLTLELNPKNGKKYLMVGEILTTAGYMEVRVNDGNWIALQAKHAVKLDELWSVVSYVDRTNKKGVSIYWKGDIGNFNFNDDNMVIFADGTDNYGCYYMVRGSNDPIVSPGSINITDVGATDKFLEGTFIIQKAGLHSDMTQTRKIEGRFSVWQGS